MPYCINKLSQLSASKDKEDKDRYKSVSLILSKEGACVLGLEIGKQEQDVI